MIKILCCAILSFLTFTFTSCDEDNSSSDADSDSDSDADSDSDSDGDSDGDTDEPGFWWEVSDGPLAGSYAYEMGVFCEQDPEGYPVLNAEETEAFQHFINIHIETPYDFPEPGEHVNDILFFWMAPGYSVSDLEGSDCYMDFMDGWPHANGTFQCLNASDLDSEFTVDIINGSFQCP